jgi:hypothetical protein
MWNYLIVVIVILTSHPYVCQIGGFTVYFYENPDCTGAVVYTYIGSPTYCESSESNDDNTSGDDDDTSLANVVVTSYCYQSDM